ncbi:hypothetical protein HAX54_048032, partial [Datura stramonium]|nr:hypothetical protein [Datura stramonium]
AKEGQIAGYDRIQEMLQTLLDRESNLKVINKSILKNVKEWKRGKYPFDDTFLGPMESSTPQEKIVDKEISKSKDEQKIIYDHSEYCENEEEEQTIKEEIFKSRSGEFDEMMRNIMGKSKRSGQFLTK